MQSRSNPKRRRKMPETQLKKKTVGTSSKSYVWVNPRSARASELRRKSYDARYSSLVKAAEDLNSCKTSEEEVSRVLNGLGHNLLEQDAVVVVNNMTNPAACLWSSWQCGKNFKLV
ncbi:unnamed protein product [Linum trigynum]|uniref:Uncharacterized protein n=1 Tax=Linum trigynum TaxID=586398 RepID=A0AAV2DAG1_9ROSI